MKVCQHCNAPISVGKAKTCRRCYHTNSRKYSFDELNDAISKSQTWPEVCIKLGMRVYGSRYSYLRSRAKLFGIEFQHLDSTLLSKASKRKYTKEYLTIQVKKAHTLLEFCTVVGLQPGINNANRLRAKLIEFGIDFSHFKVRPPYRRKDIQEYLCYGSTIASAALRERLITEGFKQRQCEDCGITTWRGFPPPLELDHIDSDPMNNTFDNLRVRCSNCHAVKTIQLRKDASLERKIQRMEVDDFDIDGIIES